MQDESITTTAVTAALSPQDADPECEPPRTAWRIAAYTDWEQLNDELRRIGGAARASPDYDIARQRLDEACRAFSESYKGHRLESFYSGAQIERTWSCLHEAGRAVLMLLDDASLRARIPFIRRAVLDHVSADDPLRQPALDELDRIEGHVKHATVDRTAGSAGAGPPPEISPADRQRLRAIRALADSRSDLYQREVRAFRNLLLIFSAILGVLLVIVAAVHAIDSSLVSLCAGAETSLRGNLCPHGGTKPAHFDVLEVELVGAVGGLLAAIIPLAKARRLPGPYGFAVVQSALKVTSGAALALIGVLLLQGGVLAGLSPQPGTRVVAYAAFFGLAQQALTMLVDRRVGELAEAPAPKAAPTTPPGS